MNDSYIGVLTPCGLRALYPESEHIVRFLRRRAYRKVPYAGLVWVVLSTESVERIRYELELGESMLALRTMVASALFSGAILPQHQPDEAGAA